MRIRDIDLNKIEYNFVLSADETKTLMRSVELAKQKKLLDTDLELKEKYKIVLAPASDREERIFKNIDTIRGNAKDGKRDEWMKSMFLTKAINKALEPNFEKVSNYKTIRFVRTFYELERKQFNRNNKRVTKYRIGNKTKSLTFKKLYKYLFLINKSKY